ncbi:MAG: hypothetical protein JW737_07975 [Acidobacteria bacterium]|nr:hypothetical protein [Acidobacteriota bacterium]
MKKCYVIFDITLIFLSSCYTNPCAIVPENLEGTWILVKIKAGLDEKSISSKSLLRFSEDGRFIINQSGMKLAGIYQIIINNVFLIIASDNSYNEIHYKISKFRGDEMEAKYNHQLYSFKKVDQKTISDEEFTALGLSRDIIPPTIIYESAPGTQADYIQASICERNEIYLRMLASGLGAYYYDHKKYPPGNAVDMLKAISTDCLPDAPWRDAWGNLWFYKTDQLTYILVSYGKDGKPGPEFSRFQKFINPSDPHRWDYDYIISCGTFIRDCSGYINLVE